ncbi:acyl-CoA dehydrogenase family protein [Streptomyces sp. NPDC048436]|uniref:acyl-CoA dehydrogenase family protein n=1 Tax=Streptomyces sp. NPDC048436 TaxID=3365550 RepID=UPI003724A8C7
MTFMTVDSNRTTDNDLAAGKHLTADEILTRARAAAPVLRERAEDIEEARQLPADVVELLRGTGVFRMTMPASWGGPELTSAQQTEVIEALATGDASAAWCAMIGADSGIFAGYLDDAVARELFPSLDTITAGFMNPTGRAERVPGGYRVSGNWVFGSGSSHCDLLLAGCRVYRDGEPEADADGDPVQWRVMIARPEDFEIHDTWYTTGLAGTASRDYATTDLFVPDEHSFSFDTPRRPGLLHAAPDTILRNMPGVPLGLARAALDHVRGLAAGRVDRASGTPWSQLERVTGTLADCEADLAAARAFVYTGLDQQWARLESGREATPDERVATALARYKAFHTAHAIVTRLYALVGGAAIYRKRSPMDRWLRDVTTMCRHVDAGEQNLKAAGELLLGGRIPQKTLLW